MGDSVAGLSLLVLIIVIATSAILSYAVFRNNVKSTTNRIFLMLGLVIILWAIVMHFSLQSNTPATNLLLARFSLLLGAVINTLLLLFCVVLPNEKINIDKKKLYLLLVSGLGIMVLTQTNLVFKGVEVDDGGGISPIPGFGMGIFMAYIISTTIAIIIVLIKRLKSSGPPLNNQLRLVFIGICTMLGLIIVTIIVPVAAFQYTVFLPLFPLYSLFFMGFTAYAVVRHSLFNIKVIAVQAITVILWIVLFSKLFVQQSMSVFVTDGLIFIASVVFGILLIRSVTREIKQREKLQALTEQLGKMDERKDEFISMAAHELRAPMTAIKGYLSMLLEGDAGELPDVVHEYIEDALEGSDRAIRLVNNMLNVSRIEEGRMVYQAGTVNLGSVAKVVTSQFNEEAKRNGLVLTMQLPGNVRDRVFVDQDRIYEVVGNLVSNAVKYTEKGSVTLKISNPEESVVRLEVIDTGLGISAEEQKKLFQKFKRVESSAGKTIGSGLGLYISKLLVERFGGKIGLVSIPGKGSNFWFDLPLNYQTTN